MSAVLQAFPTLRPQDSLPARIQRIWSPTYRTSLPLVYASPNDEGYGTETSLISRSEMAKELKWARKHGWKYERRGNGWFIEEGGW